MPQALVNNINLYYEIHGEGDPLVLIPGIGSDHSRWLGILDYFKKYFKVILFDPRDTGRSDATDCHYTTATVADDIVALLKKLNIKKAHIVGHSMGGAIAQYIAILYPHLVDKLVLYSTFAKISIRSVLIMKYNVELMDKGVEPAFALRDIIFWLYSNTLLSSENKIQQEINNMLSNPFPQSLEAFNRQLVAGEEHNSKAELSKIKAKTLIIAGENDIMTTKEDLNDLIIGVPHAQIKTFPEMGHCTHIEMPGEFAETIKTFCLNEK